MQIVSLFCGCGGLDLGFEEAGFDVKLALDRDSNAIDSYNLNLRTTSGVVRDLSEVDGAELANYLGLVGRDEPIGVIGGPPCQYFSIGNSFRRVDDHRRFMPRKFATLVQELALDIGVDFFVFENVRSLASKKHRGDLEEILAILKGRFWIYQSVLDAVNFGVAQYRKRLFIVGFNKGRHDPQSFEFPRPIPGSPITVEEKIRGLPPATFFDHGLTRDQIAFHPNHWTMRPKSKKFSNGALLTGSGRSFRVLKWNEPSLTVAYGNREIHVHPDLKRRLTIFEALQLQGFPRRFELMGSLSSQVNQVSNAVPPPLAKAIGLAVKAAQIES